MENRSTSSGAQCHGSAHTSQFSPTIQPAMQTSQFSRLPNADPRPYGLSAMYNTNIQQHGPVPMQQLLKSHMASSSIPLNDTPLQQRAPVPLATRPYILQHPPHPLYQPNYSSSNGRAGPLPMTSNNTMERFLLSTQTQARLPQSATLGQVKPTCISYNLAGNSQVGRPRFPNSYSASSYVTDVMNAQQAGMGEVVEADSSTALRDSSSHLNRKKRKACGRCGPCQRKDNCGTCMNCINRAKGKQICVFRKCEELKKKPATGTLPEYSSELPGIRPDKRKEPVQQHIYERKRSRSELNSEIPVKLNPIHHVHPPRQQTANHQPVYTSLPETTLPRPYGREIYEASSYLNSLNQAVSPSSSVSRSNQQSIPNTEQQETTDVISEALREIAENSDENTADIRSIGLLHPPLDFSPDKIPSVVYSSRSSSPANLQLTQWNHKLSRIEPSPCLSRSSSDEQAANLHEFYPNSNFDVVDSDYKSTVSSQRLPDQLLSNLTHYNDFSTFQKPQYSALGIHAYSKTSETDAPSVECSANAYVDANLDDYTDLLNTKSLANSSNGYPLDLNAPCTSAEIPVSTPYSEDIKSAEGTSFQVTGTENSIPSTNDLGFLPGLNMLSSSSSIETGLRYSVTDVMQRVNCSERSNFQNNGSVNMLPQTHGYQNVAGVGNVFSSYGSNSSCDKPQVSTDKFISKLPSNVHLKDSYSHLYSDSRIAGNFQETTSKQYHSTVLQHNRPQLPNLQHDASGLGSAGIKQTPWSLFGHQEKMQAQQQFDDRSPYTLSMQSQSSLHSPVPELISNSPSGNDTNPTFGHMPKLSPSPVPHSDGEAASQTLDAGQTSNVSHLIHSSYTGMASILDARVIENSNDRVSLHKTANNYDSSPFLVQPGSSIAFERNHPASLTQSASQSTPEMPGTFNSAARTNKPKEFSGDISQANGQQFPATSDSSSLSRRSSGDSEMGLGKERFFRPQTVNGRIRNDSRDQAASDTNTTISPGESGYDSADIQSQLLESKAGEQQIASSTRSSETKEKENMKFTEDTRSKNLFRAPVDTLAASDVCGKKLEDGCHGDLLTAGACTVETNSLSATRTMAASVNSFMNCGQIPGQFNGENGVSPKVSWCGNKEDTIPDNMLLTSCGPTTEYRKARKDYQTTNNKDNMSSPVCDFSQYKPVMDALTDACPQTPVRDHENEAGMKAFIPHVFPAVDTPPVTPHSVELNLKFGDFPLTCGTGAISTNSLTNMLPTPPYTSDTAVSNCPPEYRHLTMETPRKFHTTNSDPAYQTAFLNVNLLTSDPKTIAGSQVSQVPSEKEPVAEEARDAKTGVTNKPDVKPLSPSCDCFKGTDCRNDDAPYYTHLGTAESVPALRQLFEKRTGFTGAAIRIEKVLYSGKEGKTSRGCPIAKWIIRRSSDEEKVLVICRKRPGHSCQYAVTAIIIMLWEGVARPLADFAYANYSDMIPKNGDPTERRCGTNEDRTCACQGFNEDICGASFSFGCSWSMYYNGCKFARSNQPNKYKLAATKNAQAEKFVGKLCERLATVMSPIYKMAAPDAFYNQVRLEKDGYECRLGENTEEYSRPFSGVTACMDFCAHAHKDQHNMDSGSTLVVTLTKPELRKVGIKPSDEQLHVLPLYKLDVTDEQGSEEGMKEKIANGAVEILHGFRRQVRLYVEPRLTKKQKAKAKKKPNRRSAAFDDVFSPPAKRGRPPKRSKSFENLHMASSSPNILQKPSINLSPQYGMQFHKNSPVHSRFQTPPQVQRRFSSQPYPHSTSHHQFPFSQTNPHASPNREDFYATNSPTLWPYRRHSNVQPVPQEQKSEALPSAESSAANEHLPSIGSFFTNNAVTNSPMTPEQTPVNSIPQSPNAPAGPGLPPQLKNSLPSIKDVVSHPFHETFSVVKREAHQDLKDHAPAPGELIPKAAEFMSPHNLTSVVDHNTRAPLQFPHMPAIHSELQFHRESTTPDYARSPSVTQTPQMPLSHAAQDSSVFSDSEENFLDSEIGGVAIAPGHGSVLIECAYRELHATTPLLHPNRFYPSRISLVFYQHKSLNCRNHGAAEYEEKEEKRQQQREEKKMEELIKEQLNRTLQQQNHIVPADVMAQVRSSPATSLPKQNHFPHNPSVGYMREVKTEPTNDRDPFNGVPDGRQHLYPYNNSYGWGSPHANRTFANRQSFFPNQFCKRSPGPPSPLRPPCHSEIATGCQRPYLPTDAPQPRNSVPSKFHTQQNFSVANYERHIQYPSYSYPSLDCRYMHQQQTNRDIAMQYASAKTNHGGFLSNAHQYKSSGMSPWPVHNGMLQVPPSIPQVYNRDNNTSLHYGTAPHNGMAPFHSQSLKHSYLPTAPRSPYIHSNVAQYTGVHSSAKPYLTSAQNTAYCSQSQAAFMPNAHR